MNLLFRKNNLILLVLIMACTSSFAQFKVRTDNWVQIGYDNYSTLTFGPHSASGYNNGNWAIEYLEYGYDGLNFWKPWPSSAPASGGNFLLFLKDNGNIGIANGNPQYKLDVDGDISITGSYLTSSDIRLKENISPVSNCLGKITQLNGISYNYIDNPKNKLELPEELMKKKGMDKVDNTASKKSMKKEKHIGFSAQEVRELFPDLVREDSAGYLAVDYIGMIPLLVESIKEQQLKIEELEALLSEKESTINFKEGLKSIHSGYKLYQNSPNPFSDETVIKYSLGSDLNNVKIVIYDLQGKQLKAIELDSEKGDSSVTIPADELYPGQFIYSLIVDNAIVESKRMIIL